MLIVKMVQMEENHNAIKMGYSTVVQSTNSVCIPDEDI